MGEGGGREPQVPGLYCGQADDQAQRHCPGIPHGGCSSFCCLGDQDDQDGSELGARQLEGCHKPPHSPPSTWLLAGHPASHAFYLPCLAQALAWLTKGSRMQPLVAVPNAPDTGTQGLPKPIQSQRAQETAPHTGLHYPLSHHRSPMPKWGDMGEGHSVGAQVWDAPIDVLHKH